MPDAALVVARFIGLAPPDFGLTGVRSLSWEISALFFLDLDLELLSEKELPSSLTSILLDSLQLWLIDVL